MVKSVSEPHKPYDYVRKRDIRFACNQKYLSAFVTATKDTGNIVIVNLTQHAQV